MNSISAIFLSSIVVALSGAMMPGPLLTVTIGESARRGAWVGPKLIAGHAILELLLLIALLAGLGPFLTNPYFFIILALVGGAVMLWMGAGMFRSVKTLSLNTVGQAESKGNLLLAGALMSLANPYWIIWWATIGIGYIIHAQNSGNSGIAAFYTGHILGDLAWYSLVSLAIGKGKKLLTDKTYRILIGVCAFFLVGFAVYLIITGLTKLIN
jgi:threonine/homoserine/homoserine lactone efflux protein